MDSIPYEPEPARARALIATIRRCRRDVRAYLEQYERGAKRPAFDARSAMIEHGRDDVVSAVIEYGLDHDGDSGVFAVDFVFLDDTECYLVCAPTYRAARGTEHVAGEIVLGLDDDPGEHLEHLHRAAADGLLARVTKDRVAWQCLSGRMWAFPQGMAAHRSCECTRAGDRRGAPASPQTMESSASQRRLSRTRTLRYGHVWRLIEERAKRGVSPGEISKWLMQHHSESYQSEKTVRTIIAYGLAGDLG